MGPAPSAAMGITGAAAVLRNKGSYRPAPSAQECHGMQVRCVQCKLCMHMAMCVAQLQVCMGCTIVANRTERKQEEF